MHQLSERGGELTVRLLGDRIRVGGKAITVVRGDMSE